MSDQETVRVNLSVNQEDLKNLSMILEERIQDLQEVLDNPTFHLAGDYQSPEEFQAMLEDVSAAMDWSEKLNGRINALLEELFYDENLANSDTIPSDSEKSYIDNTKVEGTIVHTETGRYTGESK